MASIGALTPGRAIRKVTLVTRILAESIDVPGHVRPQTKETVLTLIAKRTFRIFSGQPRRVTLVADAFVNQGVGGIGRYWASPGNRRQRDRASTAAGSAWDSPLDSGRLGNEPSPLDLSLGACCCDCGTLAHWEVQPFRWTLACCALTNTPYNRHKPVETESQVGLHL